MRVLLPLVLMVLTRKDAEQSLAFIDNASLYVSKERSKYGAYKKALEQILTNVNNAKENLISAESKLRDTDMAKEISKLQKTKYYYKHLNNDGPHKSNKPRRFRITKINKRNENLFAPLNKTR